MATNFAQAQARLALPLPRRHLAPNVIAMRPEDRPPVVNQTSRGRYPRGVEVLRRWRRLRPGMFAYLWPASPNSSNRGKIVRLVREYPDMDWHVVAVSGDLLLTDGNYARSASVKPEELRRCPAPKGTV